MEIAAYVSLLLVLSYLLVQSADLIESVFVLIAKKLNISPFVIGFLVLGIVSSLPEASLLVTSATNGVAELSLGNLLGASIILLTLVVAINSVKHGEIDFHGNFKMPEVVFSLIVILVQIFIVLDGKLSIFEGILGLLTFIVYAIVIFTAGNEGNEITEHTRLESGQIAMFALKAVGGVIGLIFFSILLVDAAVHTAGLLSIPETTIGILVLAFGTNLPEIIIALRSKNEDGEALAAGNFIGSATANTALVAILAMLADGPINNFDSIITSMIILGSAVILFAILAWSGRKISRKEGLILLGVYGLLIISELVIINAPTIANSI